MAGNTVSFHRGSLIVGWTVAEGSSILGGLRITGDSAGSIAAVLEESTDAAPWPAYTVTDLRYRAALRLAVEGAEGLHLLLDDLGPAAPRALRSLGYRLIGSLTLRNALSWPSLDPLAPVGAWLTAAFPPVPTQRFIHDVTLQFEGQRIEPKDLARQLGAIPLMVEARHTVTRGTRHSHGWSTMSSSYPRPRISQPGWSSARP